MPSLLELPSELVEQIVCVLAGKEPPSAKFIFEQPSRSLLHSGYHPLKDLSCVCQGLRRFCFNGLFSALMVNLDMEIVTDFREFIKASQLSGRVDSLVLYIETGCTGDTHLWPRMVEIIDFVNAPSVTIMLPPAVFAKILPYDLNLNDAWAFNIDFQILQLSVPRQEMVPKTPENVIRDRNIFALRPWAHCTYNEGSSVEAYSTYEYYLKDRPSLFVPSNTIDFVHTMAKSLVHIISLDFIAIFPTNLWPYEKFISLMLNLRSLRTQLAPTPSNNVLDDPVALGKCQTKDLWMEFESSYRELIDLVIGRGYGYCKLGYKGQFTILDYANPALRETLDGIVGHHLDRWERDLEGGSWTRMREDEEAISH